MKKLYLFLALAMGLNSMAYASFPVRRTFVHQQPNGQRLTISSVANGEYTVYFTSDGHAVLPAADGHYYYAEADGSGLKPSQKLALSPLEKTTAAYAAGSLTKQQAERILKQDVESKQKALKQYVHTRSINTSTADGLGEYGKSALGIVKSVGAPVIPVVMVDFADRAFQDTITTEKVTRFLNEEGYCDEPGSRGSVRDYFMAQSRGMFSPTFKVVAHVTVPKGYVYYGKDSASGSIDPNGLAFVRDALTEASKSVDFSEFRNDGTTNIPLVALMFAGPGQQSSFEDGNTNYLWAKFSQSTFTVNGGQSKVQSYLVFNELMQSYGSGKNDIIGTSIDGIGLFAHEFSHAIGLPDFYDTSASTSNPPMSYWDIMDYGQYYQNGYRPVEYTAYERSYMGWLKVKDITNEPAQVFTLAPLASDEADGEARAYVIRNPENSKEYYLLENKQKNTWLTTRMGSGMFVTHVDYNSSSWLANRVNVDGNHFRYVYVPADNARQGYVANGISFNEFFNQFKSDLYGGLNNYTSFTDATAPAATLYSGTKGYLSRPIYNVAQTADGRITFSYLDESITTGINATNKVQPAANTAVFDLNGRRVESLQNAQSGVYITGGRKVIK